jgi:hypothetical protein
LPATETARAGGQSREIAVAIAVGERFHMKLMDALTRCAQRP